MPKGYSPPYVVEVRVISQFPVMPEESGVGLMIGDFGRVQPERAMTADKMANDFKFMRRPPQSELLAPAECYACMGPLAHFFYRKLKWLIRGVESLRAVH
jgi:hypothetical protein